MTARIAIAGCAILAAIAGWVFLQQSLPDLPWWRRYTSVGLLAALALTYVALAATLVLLRRDGAAERARKVLALTLGLVVSAAAIELPAIAFGHDYRLTLGTLADNTFFNASLHTNALDPVLIHVHRPHSSFRGEVEGNLCRMGIPPKRLHPADVRYDRNGFRNAREIERADLAVIGDSFVEAELIPVDRSISALIEQETGLVTANLGQAGYGFRQELEVLRRFAQPLDPRIVIWCLFGGNDFRDVGWYEGIVGDVGRIEARRHVPMSERLFLVNLPRAVGRALRSRTLSPKARARSGVVEGEVFYFNQCEEQPTAEELRVGLEILRAARDRCDAIGARLLVAYIPSKFRVYQDLCELAPDSDCARWTSNDMPTRLAEWTASEGIPFVDLTPALSESAARGEHVYFTDDVHWNAAGHRVAASVLVRSLRERGWVAR